MPKAESCRTLGDFLMSRACGSRSIGLVLEGAFPIKKWKPSVDAIKNLSSMHIFTSEIQGTLLHPCHLVIRIL